MTWAPFPIAGGCYRDDTLPWSAQDTVNWIPVVAEVQGTRTPIMLRGAPGLKATSAIGKSGPGVAFRGAYNADGVFVLVQNQTLYRYNGDTTAPTSIGAVPGVERVSITHNQITGGSQIMIANGTAGYVYNTVDGSFAQVTDDGFPGAKSVDYIDSYIVGVEPGGRFWFNSALADATSYNTLDRYEAEAAPDKIVGLIVSHSEVIVFGERTMEFFYDSGANTTTFQRRSGTQTEVGAVSQFAIVKLDNTVYWLGNDGLIYRLDGYTPVRISLQPIEQQIARSDLSKCFAMVYEDRGHKIVYFTFPDGLTWGYDVATQEWHRRKSYRLKRWRANTLTKWAGKWYAGDYTDGSLCTLEWGVNTENGAPLVAERVAAVMHQNMNRFRLNGVKMSVDCQQPAIVTSSAQSPGGGLVEWPGNNAQQAQPVELFDSAYLWTDGTQWPPACFDGTSYVFDQGTTLTYKAPVLANDHIGVTVEFSPDDPASSLNITPYGGQPIITVPYSDQPQAVSIPVGSVLAAGKLQLLALGGSTFTLTATNPPVDAPVRAALDLFAVASNWMDDNGNVPPTAYNATTGAYTFTDTEQKLFLVGPAINGDAVRMIQKFSVIGGTDYSQTIDINADTGLAGESFGYSATPQTAELTAYDYIPARGLSIDVTAVAYESHATIELDPPAAPAPVVPDKFIVELRTSKDGGHNFGYWRQYDMGDQGQFNNQPLFRRLGLGRRIVIHTRVTGDRSRDLVACSVDTEPF